MATKLAYLVERTPNYDRVGSLGDAMRFAVEQGASLAAVVAAVADEMSLDAQFRVAQKLGYPVAELCPQAVSGDKARLRLLNKLEAQYGKGAAWKHPAPDLKEI